MMTRRALLVGINDYGKFASLKAPVPEMERWEKRLLATPYSFDKVVRPPETELTVKRVLAELEDLIAVAHEDADKKDTQLLFIFAGHGSIRPGKRPNEADGSLIVRPDGPNPEDLRDAAVTESAIEAIFATVKPPRGTDITFVLDTCFAANYGDPALFRLSGDREGGGLVPLYLPPPPEIFANGFPPVREVGWFAEHEYSDYEKPIVVAASGELQPAYELSLGKKRRLLFSARALERLERKHDRFDALIRNINPLLKGIPQQATLRGNKARAGEKFPGEPDDKNKSAIVVADSAQKPESVASDSPTSKATEGKSMDSIDMRILGFGCFVNTRDPENDLYTARIVMPYDDIGTDDDRHIAFLEIPRDEMDGDPEGLEPTWKYPRGGGSSVEFWRWDFDGHQISIVGGDQSLGFVRSSSFERHVPKITVIAPELRPRNPRVECFEATPRPDLFTAFLDIPSGSVTAGAALQNVETLFKRPAGTEPPVGPIRTPVTVTVNIPIISGESPTIEVREYNSEAVVLRVRVKIGSVLLAGNAREKDITGDGTGSAPPELFSLFYKLANLPLPPNLPLPIPVAVPIDACSVTDWP